MTKIGIVSVRIRGGGTPSQSQIGLQILRSRGCVFGALLGNLSLSQMRNMRSKEKIPAPATSEDAARRRKWVTKCEK